MAGGDGGACPRWAPSGGISGGERERTVQAKEGGCHCAGCPGTEAHWRSLGTALPRQAGELTADTRCESAAPRCGKAEIRPLQPHRVLGSAGVGGGGGGRVPLPPASRVPIACPLRLPLHPGFPLVPTLTAHPSPPAGLLKSHLLRETPSPSPPPIDLKLQTLPTPDASFPPAAFFSPITIPYTTFKTYWVHFIVHSNVNCTRVFVLFFSFFVSCTHFCIPPAHTRDSYLWAE